MLKNDATANLRRQNQLLFLLCLATVAVIIVTLLTVAGSGMNEPKTDQISVNDPRPVALAVETLEKKYGWIITYEDPPYVHESELVDVTEKVRRDLDKFKPGQAPKVLIPKGGDLTLKYSIDPATKKPVDSAVVVQQLLDAYAIAGNPGVFRLDRDGERLHIFAGAAKGKDGVLVAHRSVFDVPITLPAQKRNGLELLDAFCSAVSQASGTRVVLATVPMTLFFRYQTESGAKEQRARDFLTHEFDRMNNIKLSWRLLYDPVSKAYFLNIHTVSSLP
ncbi:MAG TPA: hypothetical protein VFI24_04710 [Pyrinomonadaceae bacterium]|nr:hypothetical protein [Pyrinomonadaceae bacterium]